MSAHSVPAIMTTISPFYPIEKLGAQIGEVQGKAKVTATTGASSTYSRARASTKYIDIHIQSNMCIHTTHSRLERERILSSLSGTFRVAIMNGCLLCSSWPLTLCLSWSICAYIYILLLLWPPVVLSLLCAFLLFESRCMLLDWSLALAYTHTHTLAMDGTVPPAINLTPHLVCLHSLLSLSVGALVVYRRHTICSQWELVVRGIFNQTCCLLTGPPTKHERELSNTTTRVCPFFSIHIASLQTPSCSYVIEFDPRPCSTMWLMCSRLATFGALFFSLTHTSHTRTTLYAMNECKYRSKSERMNTILEGSWSWPLELRAQDVALAVAS